MDLITRKQLSRPNLFSYLLTNLLTSLKRNLTRRIKLFRLPTLSTGNVCSDFITKNGKSLCAVWH